MGTSFWLRCFPDQLSVGQFLQPLKPSFPRLQTSDNMWLVSWGLRGEVGKGAPMGVCSVSSWGDENISNLHCGHGLRGSEYAKIHGIGSPLQMSKLHDNVNYSLLKINKNLLGLK